MKIVAIGKDKNNREAAIKEASAILREGGVVIYPTETCYGIGVDAVNQKAVGKLIQYKRRREGKAVSIAVADKKMAHDYVEINETAESFYEKFLPGPLTVVSLSKGKAVSELEAENGTLGVRMPKYPLVIDLIKSLGRPITATSANVSGRKTPYSLNDVLENTSREKQKIVDLFLDAGRLLKRAPSTVVDTTLHKAEVIRKGKIKIDEAEGEIFISQSEEETKKIAQKMLFRLNKKRKDNCIIFALQGELGVGKTRFAKGMGRGLAVEKIVKSPTYILAREYDIEGKNKFYHIDTWRMREEKELLELGWETMLRPGNVIVVEWLEKVKKILKKAEKKEKVLVVWVDIRCLGKGKRELRVSGLWV